MINHIESEITNSQKNKFAKNLKNLIKTKKTKKYLIVTNRGSEQPQ